MTRQSDDLLSAPLWAALIEIAMAENVPAAQFAEAAIVHSLVNKVRRRLDRWRPNQQLPTQPGREAKTFAAELISGQYLGWTRALFADGRQLVIEDVDPADSSESPEHLRRFETYAQRPVSGILSSTVIDGQCSLLSSALAHVGDIEAPCSPFAYARPSSPSPRVAEIQTAIDWYEFCSETHMDTVDYDSYIDEGGFLSPDWQAAKKRFDAVHLTLDGFLSATSAPITGERYQTCLWAWEGESTVWLTREVVISSF